MQNSRKPNLKARCPHCLAYVQLRDSVEMWDIFSCQECGTSLEVVGLHPPMLDYLADDFPEDEEWEDWEDEEEWGDVA